MRSMLDDERLVTRSQNPSHTARLYVLEANALPGGPLRAFLKVAVTRQGRLEAMRPLGAGPNRTPSAELRRKGSLADGNA
jgi:hypothetical protein